MGEIGKARFQFGALACADRRHQRAHLGQLAALLAGDEPVGRTLDFLIQEINREVNTVGSKADDLEISQTVIAAKATLEKMREQVQNIE